MTHTQFIQSISKGKVKPVYLLCGNEPFLVEHTLRRALKELIPPGSGDVGLTSFHADETDDRTIFGECRTLPFLSDRRVVVVRNAHLIEQSARTEAFETYLGSVNPTTVLLLVSSDIDKRKKLYKAVRKCGDAEAVDCAPPKRNEIPQWIRDEAKARGKRIAANAVAALTRSVGSDLQVLTNELNNISSFVGERETIEREDVEAVTSVQFHERVFALSDAIGARNAKGALEMLDGLLDTGERVASVLGYIDRHFKHLYRTRQLLDGGVPREKLAEKMGVHPFFAQNLAAQATSRSLDELSDVFAPIVVAELSIKTSAMPERTALEMLVLHLCGIGWTPPRKSKRKL